MTLDKEPLIDVWRRQFLKELDDKIAAAQLSVDCTEPGGWFQGQLKRAVEMYRAARDAVELAKPHVAPSAGRTGMSIGAETSEDSAS